MQLIMQLCFCNAQPLAAQSSAKRVLLQMALNVCVHIITMLQCVYVECASVQVCLVYEQ